MFKSSPTRHCMSGPFKCGRADRHLSAFSSGARPSSYFQWNMIDRCLLARYTVQSPSRFSTFPPNFYFILFFLFLFLLFLLIFKCVILIYLVLLTFLYCSFKNNDLVFIETLLFCVCSYLIGLHNMSPWIICQALFYVGDVLVEKTKSCPHGSWEDRQ